MNKKKTDTGSREIDITFGVLYTICIIFGTLANVMSFLYFIKRKTGAATNKTYMIYLYRIITFVDILICFLVFPLIEASFYQTDERSTQGKQPVLSDGRGKQGKIKKPVLFGDSVFCTIWGLLWNILPVLSVVLVAILSFSRCLLLLYPLIKLDIKKPVIFLTVATLIMITEKLVAQFSSVKEIYGGVKYRYREKLVSACYLSSGKVHAAESTYDSAQSFIFLFLLGLPVIPILVSFIVTVYKLRVAQKNEGEVMSIEKSKHMKATITVMIVTGIYIICNIPVLICHLYFVNHLVDNMKTLKAKVKANGGSGLKSYLDNWTIVFSTSYTLLVAVNSTLNPIIYFTRMKLFRNFVIKRKVGAVKFLCESGSRISRVSRQVAANETENISNNFNDNL